jgi:hypothetical protein
MKKLMRNLALIAICLMLVGTLGIGCSRPTFTPPLATTLQDTPIELTAKKLYDEFMANPEATKAKYEGKKLHFAWVKVEKMSFLGEPPDTDLFVQEGLVKFRIATPSQLVPVREGYIVEVVGSLWDIQYTYVIVRDCWLKCIDPPGGDPNPPPEY